MSKGAFLTRREQQVVRLVAQGLSNREVAEQLVITEKTAKNHVQRVLDKLGVHSRMQIIARAHELVSWPASLSLEDDRHRFAASRLYRAN
jgi:DNA-binding NarL/FixJ family response regulator